MAQISDLTGNAVIAENDRISSLLEPLVDHILSFLDIKEAVHTCLLSKTWRYAWKSLLELCFDFNSSSQNPFVSDNDAKIEQFVLYASNVLFNLPDGVRIRKFTLRDWKTDSPDQFNNWMESTILRHIQELHLENWIRLFPTSLVGHVKSLTLKRVLFTSQLSPSDNDERVIFNLPKVQNMVLDDCYWLKPHVYLISAPSLYYLSVVLSPCTRGGQAITISVPNLICLYYKVKLDDNKVDDKVTFVDSMPFLVRAEIEIHTDFDTRDKPENDTTDEPENNMELGKREVLLLLKILKQVCNAKYLTVSISVIQFWPDIVLESLKRDPIRFHSAKNLKLKDCNLDGDNHLLATFLESFPCLETLVLENSEGSYVNSKKKPPKVSNCDFQNLKSVEIRGYNGRENQLNLLEFFIRHAASLEKIVITVEEENNRGKTLRHSLVRRLKAWGVVPKLIDSEVPKLIANRVGSVKVGKRRSKNEVKNLKDLNTTELQYFSLGLKTC